MRGAPHVGLSPTTRKMSSRNSLLTNVLPTRTLRREIQAQYSLKPSRCQRTTVSGWDQGQCTLPSWPQSAQHNPEEFIRACQSRPRTIPPQDPNLLPKSQVFQEQVAA